MNTNLPQRMGKKKYSYSSTGGAVPHQRGLPRQNAPCTSVGDCKWTFSTLVVHSRESCALTSQEEPLNTGVNSSVSLLNWKADQPPCHISSWHLCRFLLGILFYKELIGSIMKKYVLRHCLSVARFGSLMITFPLGPKWCGLHSAAMLTNSKSSFAYRVKSNS